MSSAHFMSDASLLSKCAATRQKCRIRRGQRGDERKRVTQTCKEHDDIGRPCYRRTNQPSEHCCHLHPCRLSRQQPDLILFTSTFIPQSTRSAFVNNKPDPTGVHFGQRRAERAKRLTPKRKKTVSSRTRTPSTRSSCQDVFFCAKMKHAILTVAAHS